MKIDKLICIAFGICALFGTGITVSAQYKIRYSGPIIDMHMHARLKMVRDANGNPLPRPCDPVPTCVQIPAFAKEDGDVLRLTLQEMDRYNIVLGFLSDDVPSVEQWVAAAPGRFIPSPSVSDPAKADLAALREGFRSGKLRGMGELLNQYEGIAANDPRMDPIFALANEFDLPTLIHHNGGAGPSSKFRIAQGHPELLQEVCEKYPHLRLYVENAGFPFLDEIIALLFRYPNVYVDVSTATWIKPRPLFHQFLRGLIAAGLSKRIMFGSDQMEWPGAIEAAVESIDSADFLTPEQKADIFYNNAARFLRLSDKGIAKHHEMAKDHGK